MVRPIFFSVGVISRFFFFLGICTQINACAFSAKLRITVYLVHAPSFWWSPSCSFTFSFLCVFFQFLYVVRCFCLRFLCFVFVTWLSSFGYRFNRGYPLFHWYMIIISLAKLIWIVQKCCLYSLKQKLFLLYTSTVFVTTTCDRLKKCIYENSYEVIKTPFCSILLHVRI